MLDAFCRFSLILAYLAIPLIVSTKFSRVFGNISFLLIPPSSPRRADNSVNRRFCSSTTSIHNKYGNLYHSNLSVVNDVRLASADARADAPAAAPNQLCDKSLSIQA